jgi:hypothetical protein
MWPGVVYETLLMQAPTFMQAGTLETAAIAGIIIGKTFAWLLQPLEICWAATQGTHLVHWFLQTRLKYMIEGCACKKIFKTAVSDLLSPNSDRIRL